jgi:glycine cleavage system aminomethyltransferase T/glycine/D-amino acid oxidase-like deaminating enzyme
MSNSDNARVVIIGGGVIGLGIAYHLAKLGAADVLLIERNVLTGGTSWHAAGIVGPLRSSMNLTRLATYATQLFSSLEAHTGQATGYRKTGGFWLARTPERMFELHRIGAMGEMTGLTTRIVRPEDIAQRVPTLRVTDLAGGLWVAEDGQASPVDICVAYAKGARAGGVRIREGVACVGIDSCKGAVSGVRLSNGEFIRCQAIVNCAGAWASRVGAMAGVPVPLQAVEHMYVVTEPIPDLPTPFPILRDLDGGIYIKEDAGKLVVGGFEPNAKVWNPAGPGGDVAFLEFPEDWEQFEPFSSAMLHRIPALVNVGIRKFMNGPESFTPDTKPLLGESPFLRGFFVAAGFNSIGMMSSAGVGKAMAEWIVAGEAPMDLWEVDIARFDRAAAAKSFLVERMQEAVSDQFAMHWPYKQASVGRNVRRTALHHSLAAAGAVFGVAAGWERPLWFARAEGESQLTYSHGSQSWWPAAARESEAVGERVALFDLTPFTKIDVDGPDALALLQQLCCNDLDVEAGRSVYTLMLNERGGIEADVTVTRWGEMQFRIISAAATRWKDLAWVRRQRDRLGLTAGVVDASSSEVVLGVMGPKSRELLQSLSNADLSPDAFTFSTSKQIELAMAVVRATRVSFVGELGWELYVPTEFAENVYAAVLEAGASQGMAHAGLFALDACRMEKGYRHWGHDIGPEDTPLEAGLAFAVAWDKPSGFIGRDALRRQQAQGVTRHLLLFAVTGQHPLLLHNEPVYRDGKLVGRSTSGARGFRTGLSVCLAYLACEAGAPKSAALAGHYEIGVAGKRYALQLLPRPPFDPTGARLRS